MHAGVLQELVHRLSELRLLAPRRATVVVPLTDGAIEQARQLAAQGPPFDPVETMLVRHQLLLTPSEAIFVFEADSELGLEELLGQLDVWAAATPGATSSPALRAWPRSPTPGNVRLS